MKEKRFYIAGLSGEADMGKLRDSFLLGVRMFLRIVKPWKKKSLSAFKDEKRYADGWNDCIKEMQKNGNKYFRDFPEAFDRLSKQ